MPDEHYIELSDSWALFQVLRDQYGLVKSQLEDVNTYLLPGRHLDGPYLSEPGDVQLTTGIKAVLNRTGNKSLAIFSAMLYGTLTPPTQSWFELNFDDTEQEGRPVSKAAKDWLYRSTRAIHRQLNKSNFYSVMDRFFRELGAYGTAAFKCEEVSGGDSAVTFYHYTMGTYLFRLSYDDTLADFFCIKWKTPRQIVEEFGEDAPEVLQDIVEGGGGAADENVALIEHTYRIPLEDVDPESGHTVETVLYHMSADDNDKEFSVLEVDQHYEMPFFVLRAETNDTTEWGAGPGIHAMADIKRLQEIERTESFALHKQVDPPMLATNSLSGRLSTLPGAMTFVDMNPAMKSYAESLYKGSINPEQLMPKIQRIEMSIKAEFYNDVFFTAQRDPNLSPLKAREVQERSDDQYIRLSPIVSNMYSDILEPLIARVMAICMRRFFTQDQPVLPPMPPDIAEAAMTGGYPVSYSAELTSPLAKAQNIAAIKPIRRFVGLVAEISQRNPQSADYVDDDAVVKEYANLLGVPPVTVKQDEDVKQLRDARNKQRQEQVKHERQMEIGELEVKRAKVKASAAKDVATAKATTEQNGGQNAG